MTGCELQTLREIRDECFDGRTRLELTFFILKLERAAAGAAHPVTDDLAPTLSSDSCTSSLPQPPVPGQG